MYDRDKTISYPGGDDGIVITLQFSLGTRNSGAFTVNALERNVASALREAGLTPELHESLTIVHVERMPVVQKGEVLYEL